jgi:hypothetical protein
LSSADEKTRRFSLRFSFSLCLVVRSTPFLMILNFPWK